MTYEDAIAYWYGRINYEIKAANPGDLKLERMRSLLRLLGDPHEQFRSIHITGTKGKGSTAAMLASVLQATGYRVGLFTSPHLVDVEERIQIQRTPISRGELAALIAEIAEAVQEMRDRPTFFEIGTALGFLHFARRRVDFAVVEVGLGGRFDSTNVIHPLVSVITSVGYDHTAQLGKTLESIAFQKAGIIKHRSPVVSGVVEPEAASVIAGIAKECCVSLSKLDRDFRVEQDPKKNSTLTLVTCRHRYESIDLSLPGRHQAKNAALVAETVERLRECGISISEMSLRTGLSQTQWPARIELVSKKPTIILDTAHNEPSIEALLETIREKFPVSGKKRLIFAVSNDKPFEKMLAQLSSEFDEIFLTKYGNNPRCVSPEQLSEILRTVDRQKTSKNFSVAADALVEARAVSNPDDQICITGSFFLAGELRPLLVQN
ncbi:MAG: folylpolyglutamate synthase/dihydrofolate synthase family protein [Gemmataceae bacterium]